MGSMKENKDSTKEDVLIVKLGKILNLLSENDSKELLDNFEKWQSKRKSSIGALEELEKELIDVKYKTDIARGIGTGASILGCLSALVGFGLSLNDSTKETGDNMMKGGIAVGTLGGATSLAAAGTNCYLTCRKFENAKEILEKDRCSTDKLLQFLRKAEELDMLFMEIFDCGIESITLRDIFKIFEHLSTIRKETDKDMSEVFEEISAAWEKKSEGAEKVMEMVTITPNIQTVLKKLCSNEQSRKSVIEILQLIKRTPLAIEVPKFFLSLKNCLPYIKDVPLFSSILSMTKHSLYTVTFNSVFVVFSLIQLGVDVVALLSLKEDFAEKGTEYSKMLKDAAVLLKT